MIITILTIRKKKKKKINAEGKKMKKKNNKKINEEEKKLEKKNKKLKKKIKKKYRFWVDYKNLICFYTRYFTPN